MGRRYRERKLNLNGKDSRMTALSDCYKSFEKLEIFPKLLDEINPNIKFSKDTSEKNYNSKIF